MAGTFQEVALNMPVGATKLIQINICNSLFLCFNMALRFFILFISMKWFVEGLLF